MRPARLSRVVHQETRLSPAFQQVPPFKKGFVGPLSGLESGWVLIKERTAVFATSVAAGTRPSAKSRCCSDPKSESVKRVGWRPVGPKSLKQKI